MISIHLYKSTSPSCRGRVNIECLRRAGGWSGGRDRWISLVNPESRVKGTSPKVHTLGSSGMPLGMDRNIAPIEGNIDHVERNRSLDDSRLMCFLYKHTWILFSQMIILQHLLQIDILKPTWLGQWRDQCPNMTSVKTPQIVHILNTWKYLVIQYTNYDIFNTLNSLTFPKKKLQKRGLYSVKSCPKSVCSS